ncbi:hypothetical protein MFUM_700030 [Methylacidiphilum fumariolicum SolV]|uniref:Uncharacterized protein n=1 Tax=Methylacidiphilum fumariolicum (strain SolV) TaxID=1156937 RepID=I0JZ12_METFB|nr:hypothetical protein MFUM_700030 [Methylacidiphilum fumariolicum SolV]
MIVYGLSQLPFGFIHYSDRSHAYRARNARWYVSIAFRLHPLFRPLGFNPLEPRSLSVSIAFRLHPLFRRVSGI